MAMSSIHVYVHVCGLVCFHVRVQDLSSCPLTWIYRNLMPNWQNGPVHQWRENIKYYRTKYSRGFSHLLLRKTVPQGLFKVVLPAAWYSTVCLHLL
jgi:hypothetical protein